MRVWYLVEGEEVHDGKLFGGERRSVPAFSWSYPKKYIPTWNPGAAGGVSRSD